MNANWKELEELGVDWEEFCELKGINIWARNEGLMDEEKDSIYLSIPEFKKLVPRLNSKQYI